ncbi:MAG: 1-phosphofructokinase family hexose kinase [Acidimicrobiales bacterium]
MIATLTLNPSLDRTVVVGSLRRGAVNRANLVSYQPSGKGVNVARALHANGIETKAVLPVGGVHGARLLELLEDEGVAAVAVPIGGDIRVNLSIVEPGGMVTKLNEPGPALRSSEIDALFSAAEELASSVSWFVVSGSLPGGVPETIYHDLVVALSKAGAQVALDTSGASLASGVRAGPDLVKPNLYELGEVTGRGPRTGGLRTIGDALDASRSLVDLGCRSVLASLGADGALLVEQGAAFHGEAQVPRVKSAVGAGDALLAGFLAGGGRGASSLREGLAWAGAACGEPGSDMRRVSAEDRAAVRAHGELPTFRRLGRREPAPSPRAESSQDWPL